MHWTLLSSQARSLKWSFSTSITSSIYATDTESGDRQKKNEKKVKRSRWMTMRRLWESRRDLLLFSFLLAQILSRNVETCSSFSAILICIHSIYKHREFAENLMKNVFFSFKLTMTTSKSRVFLNIIATSESRASLKIMTILAIITMYQTLLLNQVKS